MPFTHPARRAAEPPEPAEHFGSFEAQDRAAHLGMWLFLTSEVLLFGALFGLYTAYRVIYGRSFIEAAHHNDAVIGTLNTLVLITSSFFAAWAVHAIRLDRRRFAALCLVATLGLGALFLLLKSAEYAALFREGIYPGALYRFRELPARGANVFFSLYYFITGLHGLHVIGGMVTLAVMAILTARGRYSAERHTPLELAVLYWHLVDVIWIFVWPLMYLVG